MHQIVYVSTATRAMSQSDIAAILNVSRVNNRHVGLTGLLYSDGRRFLQALEGPRDALDVTLARIRADDRHRAVVVLSERDIDEREFGDWAMAHRMPGTDGNAFVTRIGDMVRSASPSVRATFEGFASVRYAA